MTEPKGLHGMAGEVPPPTDNIYWPNAHKMADRALAAFSACLWRAAVVIDVAEANAKCERGKRG